MHNCETSIADDLPPENLKEIYKPEFQAYVRLVETLGIEFDSAMVIVGFWNWLESVGFRNTVERTLSLSRWEFEALAGDSLSCFEFLKDDSPAQTELVIGTSLILHVGPGFSPEFARSHRDSAIESIDWFVESVCKRGFDVDEDDYRAFGQREEDHEDDKVQRLLRFYTPGGVCSWIECCMPALNGFSNW